MNTILYDLARKTPICFRRPWVFKKPDIVAQIVFIQSFSLMYVLLQGRPPK